MADGQASLRNQRLKRSDSSSVPSFGGESVRDAGPQLTAPPPVRTDAHLRRLPGCAGASGDFHKNILTPSFLNSVFTMSWKAVRDYVFLLSGQYSLSFSPGDQSFHFLWITPPARPLSL